jgi:hypothetical protein
MSVNRSVAAGLAAFAVAGTIRSVPSSAVARRSLTFAIGVASLREAARMAPTG